MAISTGVGAIISIPAGLAALKSLDAAGELEYLFRDLKNASLDPDQKKKLEQDVAAAKGLGGDLKDVVKGTKAFLYVNGSQQPCLIVNDLKLGQTEGQVALWNGSDTEAYFSRLRISQ